MNIRTDSLGKLGKQCHIHRRLSIHMLLLVAGMSGCSDGGLPDMVPIRGEVRNNGTPLDHGTVMFIPISGARQASAQIQLDGSYELTTLKNGDGAQVGEYKVVIHSLEPHPGEPGRVGHEQDVPAAIKRGHEIPQQYTQLQTTPLAVNVTQDHSGVEDFDLNGTQ